MKLKFCSCRHCKNGRRSHSWMITKVVRKARRKVKQMLKQGKWEEIPTCISVPYTD